MLAVKIAYRFLKNRKGQTVLIASAIAIGISIQIFLGLLIENLQNDLIETTIGETSHITLKSKENEIIENGESVEKLVKESDERIETSIIVLDRPGLLIKEDNSIAVFIKSFNLEEGEKIYNLNEKYIQGKAPKKKNEIAIGKTLAENLGVNINESLNILTPENKMIEVRVSGILDLKVEALNRSYALTNMDTIRDIYSLKDNSITSIEMQLSNKDIFKAEEIQNKINSNTQEKYTITNWMKENESLLSGLKGQTASSYTIQVFIVLSVLVAIASILSITVLQKTKQIGILKAMGITDEKASLIFIVQGAMLGAFGAILGSVLGIGFFEIFQSLVKNSDGTPLISGNINIYFIMISSIIAIIACIISSIIPAVKSLKLNPVEAIKL